MKIKNLSFVFFGLMLALVLSSFTAFAALPVGTVVIGDKAYDLNYANDSKNQDEISSVLASSDGKVYVKGFDGSWIDNITGLTPQISSIMPVIYKSSTETVPYSEPDDTINPITPAKNASVTASFKFNSEQVCVAQDQSLLNICDVTLSAKSGDVTITGLKVARSGLSTDSCVRGISIWNGSDRISPSTAIKDGFADISFIHPVTISAGQNITVSIKMDISSTAAPTSQIVIGLNDKSAIKTEANVTGTFPATSRALTVVKIADLGSIAAELSNVPSSVNTKTSDISLENIKIKVTSGYITLNSITLTQDGSANDTDISNLKLYNGDKQIGTAQKIVDGKVTFNIPQSNTTKISIGNDMYGQMRPDQLKPGDEIVYTLKGNILSGSGKNLKFEIADRNDIQATDCSGLSIIVTTPDKVTLGNNISTQIK